MNVSFDKELLDKNLIVSASKLQDKKLVGYVYIHDVVDLNDKKVDFSRKNIQSKRDNLAKIQGKVESDKKSEKKVDENNKEFDGLDVILNHYVEVMKPRKS